MPESQFSGPSTDRTELLQVNKKSILLNNEENPSEEKLDEITAFLGRGMQVLLRHVSASLTGVCGKQMVSDRTGPSALIG